MWQRVFVLLTGFLLAAPLVNATSTVAPPEIRIYVRDSAAGGLGGDQRFVVPPAPVRPLTFSASITRTSASLPSDVYFGVIAPDGRTFTWVRNDGGGIALVQGMSPAATAMTDEVFHTTSALMGDPEYAFSDADAPGLYLLFALLVPPGADPTDARQWTWVTTVPLMFQGLTSQASR